MTESAIHAGLKAAYEDIAYVGRPNHHSHPDRLAAIASLFGHAAPDPARARILEVGCGDAANILPLAAQLPDARVVGCDYSALLMGRARTRTAALGLVNVELVEGDLREIGPSLGAFDYVIAHGFYSWVPADVRDAFIAMLGRQLAPGGLAFISYNVLPGCFVRRIGWDAIRMNIPADASPTERLDITRREFRDLLVFLASDADQGFDTAVEEVLSLHDGFSIGGRKDCCHSRAIGCSKALAVVAESEIRCADSPIVRDIQQVGFRLRRDRPEPYITAGTDSELLAIV